MQKVLIPKLTCWSVCFHKGAKFCHSDSRDEQHKYFLYCQVPIHTGNSDWEHCPAELDFE